MSRGVHENHSCIFELNQFDQVKNFTTISTCRQFSISLIIIMDYHATTFSWLVWICLASIYNWTKSTTYCTFYYQRKIVQFWPSKYPFKNVRRNVPNNIGSILLYDWKIAKYRICLFVKMNQNCKIACIFTEVIHFQVLSLIKYWITKNNHLFYIFWCKTFLL